MENIRNAARALIVSENSILTIQMRNINGEFYVLPGGGQLHGETLPDTLQRECKEELGIKIIVGKLLYTREYIGKNHQFSNLHKNFHQVEHVFTCKLIDGTNIGKGHAQDRKQIGFKWINFNEIENYNLLPSILKTFIKKNKLQTLDNYLGDIN